MSLSLPFSLIKKAGLPTTQVISKEQSEIDPNETMIVESPSVKNVQKNSKGFGNSPILDKK